MPGVHLVGPLDLSRHAPIVAFSIDRIEAHGLASLLSNRYGIMVRSGFHCAQPLHSTLQWRPTVRASIYHYNTPSEINQFVDAVRTLIAIA